MPVSLKLHCTVCSVSALHGNEPCDDLVTLATQSSSGKKDSHLVRSGPQVQKKKDRQTDTVVSTSVNLVYVVMTPWLGSLTPSSG